jgi:hypothetical protein
MEDSLIEAGGETGAEIEFLRGLGTYSLPGQNIGKADLLRGYIQGAELRADWGRIDRRRILSFAKQHLSEAEAGIIEDTAGATDFAADSAEDAEGLAEDTGHLYDDPGQVLSREAL